jgi:hypothetical protein
LSSRLEGCGGPWHGRQAGDLVVGQLLIAPLGSAGTYAEYVAVSADAPLAGARWPGPGHCRRAARAHPDGIDVLVDLASDGQQFAVLARHVRRGGTAITTRYVADRETLARAGVTGVNFQLPMTVSLLDRLAAAVVAGTIMPPPIIRISLDEVPDLMCRHGHAEGKTVITM